MPKKSVRTFLISKRKQHSEDCFHQLILREKSERIYGLHAGAAEEMRQTKFIICINIYKALPVYPLT